MDKKFDILTRPRDLTGGEVEEYNNVFRDLVFDLDAQTTVRKELHYYFTQKKYATNVIQKYFYSFWRWYVLLCWKNINTFSEKEFADIFPKQLSSCFLFGVDIRDGLFHYLYKAL